MFLASMWLFINFFYFMKFLVSVDLKKKEDWQIYILFQFIKCFMILIWPLPTFGITHYHCNIFQVSQFLNTAISVQKYFLCIFGEYCDKIKRIVLLRNNDIRKGRLGNYALCLLRLLSSIVLTMLLSEEYSVECPSTMVLVD